MKVKRINNGKLLENQEFEAALVEVYTVYGMVIKNNQVCLYICQDSEDKFPIAEHCDHFEILDNRLSRYWIFGFLEGDQVYPTWIFPEWINEIYFIDKITDWEEREIRIFQAYREAMDMEFPNPFISEKAQIGNDEWLICPICIDAWESKTSIDGMVRCPNCQNILHNPRYKNEYPCPPIRSGSN